MLKGPGRFFERLKTSRLSLFDCYFTSNDPCLG